MKEMKESDVKKQKIKIKLKMLLINVLKEMEKEN